MSNFEEQMKLARSRHQSNYEIRLMQEEEKQTFEVNRKAQEEEDLQNAKRIEQRMIAEEIRNEKKKREKFINDYVIKELNRQKGQTDIKIETLKEMAEQLYFDRLIIEQQNQEYAQTIAADSGKWQTPSPST